MKQLLIETIPFRFSPQQINESIERNNGILVVEGIIQKANAKNGNGRVYPRDVLEHALKDYQALIDNGNALGELDHAESVEIKLANASHRMTKIWWEGDDVWGRMQILTTPAGNIAKELFKCGVNVGISSRALGSVKQLGEVVQVNDDLSISGFDLVSTPSTPGAFLNVLKESLQLHKNIDKYVNTNKIISSILSNY